MFNTAVKLALLCGFCAATLIACEQQKQASAAVGAIPKQILDKATNDINKAQALADEQAKALEHIDAPTTHEQ
jgi:flagellar hook-basal body complex protein FliE